MIEHRLQHRRLVRMLRYQILERLEHRSNLLRLRVELLAFVLKFGELLFELSLSR